jgi:hypothetical protein
MTTSISKLNFVVFYSKHFDQEISSVDLAKFNEEQLQVLLAEASKVSNDCLAGYEWSKSSLPNEWPDEDWPRRVRRKAGLVSSFVKVVSTEIKRRRTERHLKASERKAKALELREQSIAARLNQEQAERFIRMRYIKAAMRERFGYEVMQEVLAHAEEMAECNKQNRLIN